MSSFDKPKTSQRATKVRWLIFALSVISSWLLYLHRYTYQLIRPSLISEYGFTDDKLGYMESSFYWPYALGQLPSGAICDLFGAHLFVGIGILVWSVMLMAFALTSNIWLLGIARGLFGAAQAGTYPSLTKVTKVWFPARSRTLIQGWIASFGGRSGAAIVPFLFYGLLLLGLTWQWALIALAAAGIVFGVVFLLLFRSSPREDSRVNDAERELINDGRSPTEDAAIVPRIPLLRLASNYTLWIFAAQQFCNAGFDVMFVVHLPSFFKEAHGIDMKSNPGQLAVFISAPFLAGALGGVVAGFLNDALIARGMSRRWVRSGVAFTGNAIAASILWLLIQQVNPWTVAAMLITIKFFTDWTQPTVWGAGTDIGGRYSATVAGLINMAGNLGAGAMAVLFGKVLSMYSTVTKVGEKTITSRDYTPILYIGCGLLLFSAVSWFLIDCTNTVDRTEKENSA